jgi:putative acyl-CoA dehydrogenase
LSRELGGSARPIHLDAGLDLETRALNEDLADLTQFEARARSLCDRMAVALQASLLARSAPQAVADAFLDSRLALRGAHHYGALPAGLELSAIVDRAAIR